MLDAQCETKKSGPGSSSSLSENVVLCRNGGCLTADADDVRLWPRVLEAVLVAGVDPDREVDGGKACSVSLRLSLLLAVFPMLPLCMMSGLSISV